jgi:hypothetical protein
VPNYDARNARKKGDELNQIYPEDLPVHRWYRFVLSYPPHLVREYVEKFGLTNEHHVLDPFCGTGTTIVECKKNGLPSTGLENNPVVQFASCVKATWDVDPDALETHAEKVADATNEVLDREGLITFFPFRRKAAATKLVSCKSSRTSGFAKRIFLL